MHRAGALRLARVEAQRSARRISRSAGRKQEIYLDRAPPRRGSGEQTRRAEPAGFAVSARTETLLPERIAGVTRAGLRRARRRWPRWTRKILQRKDLGRTWPAVC